MKRHVSAVLTAVCCVLTASVLVQNYGLKTQIRQLESNLYNQMGQIESSIDGITYNIETSLEEGAAFLSDSGWSFGEMDMDAGTVSVLTEVIPKEYWPDKTKAVMICDDKEYPMVLENGVYRAEVDISLYRDTKVDAVRFETDGAVRTEALNWGLNPRYDFLPVVYAHYAGGTTGSSRDGMYTVMFDGEMEITVDQKSDAAPVKSMYMVSVIDDQEIGRTKIPGTMDRNGCLTYELKQQAVNFPCGSTFGLYVEVEDGYGLLHRAWAWREKIDENGEPVEDEHWWWRGAEGSIFSADGEPLAVHDGEFFP